MKRATWVTGIVMVILFLAGAIALIKNNSGQDNPQKIYSRFIDYGNGTVLDTKTDLMWAAYDNGASTTWQEAKQYCEKYIGGGYTDWRMPTVEELKGLYDENEPGYRPDCAVYDWKVYLTNKIRLTGGSAWTLEDHGAEAECFLFDYGCRSLMFKSVNFIMRALPVRDGSVY